MRRIGRVAIGHSGAVLFVVAATVVAAHVQAADAGSRHVTQPLAQSGIARAATSTYVDGVGDAAPGAVDLDYVIVTDVGGQVGIGLTYASGGCLERGDSLDIDIDADQSAATGDDWGVDAKLHFAPSSQPTLWKWVGTRTFPVGTSATLECKGDHDLVLVSESEIGIRTGFNFNVTLNSGVQVADRISSPWNYRLANPGPPPAPPPELTAPPARPTPGPRGRTWQDAPRLPSRIRFTGRSVKHVRLGENLYKTLRRLGSPHVVNVACWSKEDWPSVLQSATGPSDQPGSITVAFWYPRQPRWLHISPRECADVQGLMTDRRLNGRRAYGLTTVLHERVHADGYRDEARTNCYAVQLVRSFARTLGFAPLKAAELERLAVKRTRAVAPRGYWDENRCRDGGQWDLLSGVRNLDF